MEKLLRKFIENPSSLKLSEIDTILDDFGVEKINAKGSHFKYKHYNKKCDLIIPAHNNDCKDFYKKLALKYIKDFIK